jgi:hypothetical protein
MYQEFAGDGEMVARVTSIGGPSQNGWRKAGVMIRETLESGSRNVFTAATAGSGNGATFQWRTDTDGGSSSSRTLSGISLPTFVKIVRQGDTFTGYILMYGEWQQEGDSTTVVMTDPVYIGLAVTSHEDDEMTTCTLDSVSINGVATTDLTGVDVGVPLPGSSNCAMVLSIADLDGNENVGWSDVFIMLDEWLDEQLWPY